MLHFFSFVTGNDYNMLKNETPASRIKVSAMGTALFIPVIIWFINGYFLITEIMNGPIYQAIITGAIFAVLIFIVDRSLLMATNSKFLALFRILLGLVISILGAIILDEIVFKDDIEQQMMEIKNESTMDYLGNIDDLYASNLARIQAEVDNRYTAWQSAMEDAKKEADGTGGSGTKGVHAIANLKLDIADSNREAYENAKAELATLQEKIQIDKDNKISEVEEGFKDSALLMRIKALYMLVVKDSFMKAIYILFTAFIVLLELMVIILKLSWSKTNYEKRLDFIEEIGEKRMNKIRQNDPRLYESSKHYARYQETADFIRNQNIPSFFN